MNLKSISFYLALVALWSERPAFAGPTLSKTEPAPSASVPALTTIKVTFNEAVTGVDANDLVINAEAAAEVSGSRNRCQGTSPFPGTLITASLGSQGAALTRPKQDGPIS